MAESGGRGRQWTGHGAQSGCRDSSRQWSVGVAIGLLLDNWLETKPWLMIVFFLLGSAAGFFEYFPRDERIRICGRLQRQGWRKETGSLRRASRDRQWRQTAGKSPLEQFVIEADRPSGNRRRGRFVHQFGALHDHCGRGGDGFSCTRHAARRHCGRSLAGSRLSYPATSLQVCCAIRSARKADNASRSYLRCLCLYYWATCWAWCLIASPLRAILSLHLRWPL